MNNYPKKHLEFFLEQELSRALIMKNNYPLEGILFWSLYSKLTPSPEKDLKDFTIKSIISID